MKSLSIIMDGKKLLILILPVGDGTTSFYNYIYTLVAGFSENDTFRSNQIREGMIDRQLALNLIYEENKPRYNSLKWYLRYFIMNLRINNMNRLFDG